MPPAVHRVLIHGADIIQVAPVPVGLLGEDASGSKNKDIRRYQVHSTRKTNRIANMTDLYNALLHSSDPVVHLTSG